MGRVGWALYPDLFSGAVQIVLAHYVPFPLKASAPESPEDRKYCCYLEY